MWLWQGIITSLSFPLVFLTKAHLSWRNCTKKCQKLCILKMQVWRPGSHSVWSPIMKISLLDNLLTNNKFQQTVQHTETNVSSSTSHKTILHLFGMKSFTKAFMVSRHLQVGNSILEKSLRKRANIFHPFTKVKSARFQSS